MSSTPGDQRDSRSSNDEADASISKPFRPAVRDGGDRHDVMVKLLHRRCSEARWMEPPEDEHGATRNLGVLLRRNDGVYTTEPLSLNHDLVTAVKKLDIPVAFTMSSELTRNILYQITPSQTELSLDSRGSVLRIVNSVKDIATGRSSVTRDAHVCLCRQEGIVLVWADTVQEIVPQGTNVESRLLGLVFGSPRPATMVASSSQ